MPTVSGIVYDDTGAPVAGRIVRAYRRDSGVLLGQAVTSAGSGGGGGGPTDSNWTDVVFLAHGDGASVADASSFAHAAGTVTATIDTTTKKYGAGSIRLNGSTFAEFSSSTDFDLGATYTIEYWMRADSFGSNFGLVHCGNYVVGTGWTSFCFSSRWITTAMRVYFWGTTGGGMEQYVDIGSTYFTANTWIHVAIVREGTNGKVYIDGTLRGTVGSLNTPGAGNTSLFLGNWKYNSNANNEYFAGYLDDVRITKGVARYTANFTPPTASFPTSGATGSLIETGYTTPDTHNANVKLFLKFNGSNGSTSIVDSGPNNIAVNQNYANLSTAQKKYGTASLDCTGTKNIIYAHTDTIMSDTYTVEMWARPSTVTGYGGLCQKMYYDTTGGGALQTVFAIRRDGTNLVCYVGGTNNSNTQAILESAVFSAGVWVHIALVRNGTSATVFVNGVQKGTVSGLSSIANDSLVLKIGSFSYWAGSTITDYWDGYVDDFRLTNGVARYSANFTFPDPNSSGSGPADPVLANTVLFLHCEETSIVDSSPYQHQHSGTMVQATGKVGMGFDMRVRAHPNPPGAPFYFADQFSYSSNPSAAFALSTGDFTIEMWIYPSKGLASTLGGGGLMSLYVKVGPAAANVRAFSFERDSNGALSWTEATYGSTDTDNNYAYRTAAGTVPGDVWTHIAAVRASGVLHFYANGIEVPSSVTITGPGAGTLPSTAGQPCTASYSEEANTPYPFFGGQSMYLDEVRITKTARYTGPFTPPTTAESDVNTPTGAAGSYTIDLTYSGEVQVVCLDDSAGTVYNDLIHRTTPV